MQKSAGHCRIVVGGEGGRREGGRIADWPRNTEGMDTRLYERD